MIFLNRVDRWKPRQVFLADAIGALATALILGMGLVQVREHLGLDESVLYFLASLAILFCIYSVSVFLIRPRNWALFMKIIAVANLAYCPVTWFLVIMADASLWAYLYFFGETILVASIGLTEWLYAKKYHFRDFVG